MTAKPILMLVGDFLEDHEVMMPDWTPLMVGRNGPAVCPGKMPGDSVRTAVHGFGGDPTYSANPDRSFTCDATGYPALKSNLERAGGCWGEVDGSFSNANGNLLSRLRARVQL